MQQRFLGRTGFPVSVIGLGTWQLGADWGDVSEVTAQAVLDAAATAGVTFFDTADVYGDGRSESFIGRWLKANPGNAVHVATKMGRRLDQVPGNYTLANFRVWTDRSRRNLQQDTLELVQLHCPPAQVVADDRVFDALDTLVQQGAIARYGVSVETVAEAQAAMCHPNLTSIQIIVNAFRLKPLEKVLPMAAELGVGIIARVPLASGLLSGRYTVDTQFPANDHRNYNRHGRSFDVGETFSGVDYQTGVEAAAEFTELARQYGQAGATPAQIALAWLTTQQVSTIIPGARNAEQARTNADAAQIAVPAQLDLAIHELYDRRIRTNIHNRW